MIVRRPWGWGYDSTVCTVTGPPQVTPAMVRDRVVRLVPSASIGLAPRRVADARHPIGWRRCRLGEEDDAVLGRASETRGEVAELPRHVLM